VKNLIILVLSGLFILSCESLKTKEGSFRNSDGTRHGWTVFSGPRPTKVYEQDAGSVTRGKKLFTMHCEKCHGSNGTGDGPQAEKLKIKPGNLTTFSKDYSNHYVVFQINEGRSKEMPKWKDLISTKESLDISNYILSIQKK
jgi:mono/diheme cytochrome c family protein